MSQADEFFHVGNDETETKAKPAATAAPAASAAARKGTMANFLKPAPKAKAGKQPRQEEEGGEETRSSDPGDEPAAKRARKTPPAKPDLERKGAKTPVKAAKAAEGEKQDDDTDMEKEEKPQANGKSDPTLDKLDQFRHKSEMDAEEAPPAKKPVTGRAPRSEDKKRPATPAKKPTNADDVPEEKKVKPAEAKKPAPHVASRDTEPEEDQAMEPKEEKKKVPAKKPASRNTEPEEEHEETKKARPADAKKPAPRAASRDEEDQAMEPKEDKKQKKVKPAEVKKPAVQEKKRPAADDENQEEEETKSVISKPLKSYRDPNLGFSHLPHYWSNSASIREWRVDYDKVGTRANQPKIRLKNKTTGGNLMILSPFATVKTEGSMFGDWKNPNFDTWRCKEVPIDALHRHQVAAKGYNADTTNEQGDDKYAAQFLDEWVPQIRREAITFALRSKLIPFGNSGDKKKKGIPDYGKDYKGKEHHDGKTREEFIVDQLLANHVEDSIYVPVNKQTGETIDSNRRVSINGPVCEQLYPNRTRPTASYTTDPVIQKISEYKDGDGNMYYYKEYRAYGTDAKPLPVDKSQLNNNDVAAIYFGVDVVTHTVPLSVRFKLDGWILYKRAPVTNKDKTVQNDLAQSGGLAMVQDDD